jgi:predicted transcriptional regulator
MTRNPTTTFRLDEAFLERLERTAKRYGVSRAEVVRKAVAVLTLLFEEAKQDALAELAALRERYDDDDVQLIASVSKSAEGNPEARLVIDGAAPEDVRAFPVLAEGMDKVHVFLDFNHGDRAPVLAYVGDEALLIPRAQLPIGELPWPPDPTLGIVIRLGDIDLILDQEVPETHRERVKA